MDKVQDVMIDPSRGMPSTELEEFGVQSVSVMVVVPPPLASQPDTLPYTWFPPRARGRGRCGIRGFPQSGTT